MPNHHLPIEERIEELREKGCKVHHYLEPFTLEDFALAMSQLENGEHVALSHGEAVHDSEKLSKILKILGVSHSVDRYKDGRMIESLRK